MRTRWTAQISTVTALAAALAALAAPATAAPARPAPGSAAKASCVKIDFPALGYFVRATNGCSYRIQVRIILDKGPDSYCMNLAPGKEDAWPKPVYATYSHWEDCG